MNLRRLLLRNLRFHWRGNCAVFLGVAVGTAVLTGALLVGDSLRGSLRDVTLQRLGWVDQALVSGRLVREAVAEQLDGNRVCPALLLQGTASTESPARRVGRVLILGVDERFWPDGQAPIDTAFWRPAEPDDPQAAGVVLNAALARDLHVSAGDRITLRLPKTSAVPRESLLGRRDAEEAMAHLSLPVRAVLPDDRPGALFTLTPSPATPRNAFVPLRVLQDRLGPDRRVRGPKPEPRVNAFLVQGSSSEALQGELRQALTLDDWDLLLRQRPEHGYLSLDSRHMLLEPAVVEAALAAANDTGLRAAPTLVYLANSITAHPPIPLAVAAMMDAPPVPLGVLPTVVLLHAEIPYSVVAALNPSEPAPLGPFLSPGEAPLHDDEILLADWKESPLQVRAGDTVALTYFHPDDQGGLRERTATFRLRGLVPLEGVAADPGLTPAFPGITDRLTIGEWDPPFPFNGKRVHKRDEDYWKRHRATPKAYVTLKRGQELWGSRFGQLTSIRLAPTGTTSAELRQSADQFRDRLLSHLRPEQGGLVFDAVRQRGLEASVSGVGGNDFQWLFLGFSFFLIAAALLLVGLLFRLNLDRRADEIGLLLATGYRQRTVRGLLLAEGGLLAALGGLLGLAGAVLYAWLLLDRLASWWPGGLDRSLLRLHVTGGSLIIGYLASLIVSVLTIAWAVRALGRASPRALLAGETTLEADPNRDRRPARWSRWIAGLSCVGALILVACGGWVRDHEMQAMTFFSGGALFLTAALAGAWAWMHGSQAGQVGGRGARSVAQLGIRNAARHPVRSLLTAGLLAAASFLIVAVESFRRQPDPNYLDWSSGSGGFALLAESDLPIYLNLNRAWQQAIQSLSPAGQPMRGNPNRGRNEEELADRISDALRANPRPSSAEPPQGVTIVSCRLRGGDDASCLNLYQPRRPRVLGVPPALIERGGFQWAESEARTPQEKANPWLLLDRPLPDGAIPVVGEKNTVTWVLRSGLGKELEIPNERGEMVRLRVVGLLQDSVFQSQLLMSEANFHRLYPAQEGYNFFLIDIPLSRGMRVDPARMQQVDTVLSAVLGDQGLEVASTAATLREYLAVENTYLSTFQALGALGLLLGALGLAVVLLRSVWERRGELALLRALGFRKMTLAWLVLAENAFLLVLGLGAGTAAALLAVAPHLIGGAGQVPWRDLLGQLVLVLAVGLAAGAAAVAATLRAPLLPALRRE